MTPPGLLVAKSQDVTGQFTQEQVLLPGLANRHGLIAGATGTGKTVTLQGLAERFSRLGTPVFLADVKGDLSGLSVPGDEANTKVAERRQMLALSEPFAGFPVRLWDVFGERGVPMRATISEMGPLLLGRLLGLNDTQAGVLTLAFRVADDNGLLLLDLKDLREMVRHVADNAKELRTEYGNVSAASVGAIQRALLSLEEQGGTSLFGEPALEIDDLMAVDEQGRGVVNILAADKLMHSPQTYSSFLLWLLSELFENLPEVGDPEKPKLVFFFDEAHLLFKDSPKALVDKIEQVVRLIRSKGVGVYFVTQNPLDLPETVLGQLGNRVQHALRAFTPRDQKAVKAAAETFRPNPALPDVAAAITELGVGEALVSFLDAKGMPGIVTRSMICPPTSKVGPIDDAARAQLIKGSPVSDKYSVPIDRQSAYEILRGRAAGAAAPVDDEAPLDAPTSAEVELARWEAERAAERSKREQEVDKQAERARKEQERRDETERARREREFLKEQERRRKEDAKEAEKRRKATEGVLTSFAKSAARSLGSSFGRNILGGLLGGKKPSSRRR